MLSLSPIKILIVLVVALLVVGPDKLPQIARQLGGAWRTFRGFTSRVEEEVRSTMPDLPSTGDIARYARSPVALLDSLARLDNEELKPDPGAEKPVSSADEHLVPDPGAPPTEQPVPTTTPDLLQSPRGSTRTSTERARTDMAITDRLRRSTPEDQEASAMTLAQHLGELRTRLLISTAAFLVMAVIAFLFYDQLLSWLREPYCRANHGNCTLYVTGPLDGLALRIKIAAFGGLILASPVVFFELWRFVTPGLKKKEKRYAIPFALTSVILFGLGCALAYFTFEHALSFLSQIGGSSLQQIYNPNQYLSLILWMMFLFGITFEFPVLLVGLQLAHVVTPAQLLSWWRWAVIGITLAAALFTPSGDPLSMIVLAVPLVAFYFLSILVGKLARR